MEFKEEQVIQRRFRIVSILGRGAQAIVYKAIDLMSTKTVAIKQYKTEYLSPEDIAQIETESRYLIEINHPNVLQCYQMIKFEEYFLVIFEYIQGVILTEIINDHFDMHEHLVRLVDANELYNLILPYEKSPEFKQKYQEISTKHIRDRIQTYKNTLKKDEKPAQDTLASQKSPKSSLLDDKIDPSSDTNIRQADRKHEQRWTVPQEQSDNQKKASYDQLIQSLFEQLLLVLIELDRLQIMHRDLKPDNIMITQENRLKVIDFGFVKRVNFSEVSQQIVGTYGYLAPEAERKLRYTNKIDTFSAGVILFQMLFGYTPTIHTRHLRYDKIQIDNDLMFSEDLLVQKRLEPKFYEAMNSALQRNPDVRGSPQEILRIIRNDQDSTEYQYTLRVAFAGEYRVGKSTLLRNAALKNRFEHFYAHLQTIQRSMRLDNLNIRLIFCDTLGSERSERSFIPSIFRNIDLCFLTYNPEMQETYDRISHWRELVEDNSKKTLFVVVGNKFGQKEIEDQSGLRSINVQYDCDFEGILREVVRECVLKGHYQEDTGVQLKKVKGCCE